MIVIIIKSTKIIAHHKITLFRFGMIIVNNDTS